MSFRSLTKGISPNICRLCVCVIINKRSLEPFICLDLGGNKLTSQSQGFRKIKCLTAQWSPFRVLARSKVGCRGLGPVGHRRLRVDVLAATETMDLRIL